MVPCHARALLALQYFQCCIARAQTERVASPRCARSDRVVCADGAGQPHGVPVLRTGQLPVLVLLSLCAEPAGPVLVGKAGHTLLGTTGQALLPQLGPQGQIASVTLAARGVLGHLALRRALCARGAALLGRDVARSARQAGAGPLRRSVGASRTGSTRGVREEVLRLKRAGSAGRARAGGVAERAWQAVLAAVAHRVVAA